MKERKIYLDYAKGIGAILVILGHMTLYDKEGLAGFIYSFHMPMFFIISGILLYPDFSIKRLKRRVSSIIVPWFILELIMYVYYIGKSVLEGTLSAASCGRRFLGIFLHIGGTEYTGSLWYLTCYFLAIIFMDFLLSKLRLKYVAVLVGVVSYAVAFFVLQYVEVGLPWHLDAVPMGMFFISVGFLMKGLILKLDDVSGRGANGVNKSMIVGGSLLVVVGGGNLVHSLL